MRAWDCNQSTPLVREWTAIAVEPVVPRRSLSSGVTASHVDDFDFEDAIREFASARRVKPDRVTALRGMRCWRRDVGVDRHP